jgi:SAM-dependent methyltransferase
MAQASALGDCPICHTTSSLTLVHRFEEDPHYVAGCNVCSVQTILPHPSGDELKEFYLHYHNTRTPDEHMPFLIKRHAELFEDLKKRFQVNSGTGPIRYLEVGFGNGASLIAAAQAGMECSGFELDPYNVADAERRAKSSGVNVRVQFGDSNAAVEFGEKFDFIKASQLIEHLINPVDFVKSMAGLLSPNGYLYLECPNNSAPFLAVKNRLRKRFRRLNFYSSLKLNEHLWGFNRTSMTRLLQETGFEVLSCRNYPVRHPYLQPENLIWYPSLPSGVGRMLSTGRPYPFLKSLIPVFDQVASAVGSGGIGLATLGQKRSPAS